MPLVSSPLGVDEEEPHPWEGGDSVELDAVPPDTLRTLVRSIIEPHIPAGHMQALKVAEDSERQILLGLSNQVADKKKRK